MLGSSGEDALVECWAPAPSEWNARRGRRSTGAGGGKKKGAGVDRKRSVDEREEPANRQDDFQDGPEASS